MRIDVNEDRPQRMLSCDIHLDGESDPRMVRILRGGAVVAEIPCGGVHDATVLQAQVESARRLAVWPRRLWGILQQMATDYGGVPDDGSPDQRRRLYADGFLHGLRESKPPEKPQKQTWLHGFSAAKEVVEFAAGFRAEDLGRPDVSPK